MPSSEATHAGANLLSSTAKGGGVDLMHPNLTAALTKPTATASAKPLKARSARKLTARSSGHMHIYVMFQPSSASFAISCHCGPVVGVKYTEGFLASHPKAHGAHTKHPKPARR